jgi:NTP pyrophosphatase (non-canonical NTP hydrolase)
VPNYIHEIHYREIAANQGRHPGDGGLVTSARPVAVPAVERPTAVLCGSFRRDPTGLKNAFDALAAVADVLSPTSLDFTGSWDGFVFAEADSASSPRELENRHLSFLLRADFVWLFAPKGYVGPSASLEVGQAALAGVPVYSDADIDDVTIRQFVQRAASPAEAIYSLSPWSTPSDVLIQMQRYYERVARLRGYGDETVQDTMMLLMEEVGELARAIRRQVNLRRDGNPINNDAALELADIQLYVLHLANLLGVDLAKAVFEKEQINDQRYQERLASAG